MISEGKFSMGSFLSVQELSRPWRRCPGVVISESDGEVQPWASVATKLSLPAGHSLAGGARLPLSIVTTLSETGLLALECRGAVPGTQGITRDVSWKLTFNKRGAAKRTLQIARGSESDEERGVDHLAHEGDVASM